jgi:hypothetical protein
MAMDDGHHPRATYADITALPPHLVGELLRGRLYTHARPAFRHLFGASQLSFLLRSKFGEGLGGVGGWWFLDEPELHLLDDVVVPDIAAWRVEQMPTVPDVSFYTQAPAWVCEVLSPSTEAVDRSIKMSLYARAGVEHLWFLDPILRTLEVFVREDTRWLLLGVHTEDEKVRADPFADLELDLASLWIRRG